MDTLGGNKKEALGFSLGPLQGKKLRVAHSKMDTPPSIAGKNPRLLVRNGQASVNGYGEGRSAGDVGVAAIRRG
jgi:hypothetical protein